MFVTHGNGTNKNGTGTHKPRERENGCKGSKQHMASVSGVSHGAAPGRDPLNDYCRREFKSDVGGRRGRPSKCVAFRRSQPAEAVKIVAAAYKLQSWWSWNNNAHYSYTS